MSRPHRAFKVGSYVLEGRLLLTAGRITPPFHMAPTVGFRGTSTPGTTEVSQLVTQQDGTAIVTLYRFYQLTDSQVVVSTDPSSPAVGVNVGAVNQTVTFRGNQAEATVAVPVLPGAPNPGEVDVNLTITPINPPANLKTSGPLKLRILATDAMIPPKIVSVEGKPQGIVLTFSKPMDPASVSNVNNYAVHATTVRPGGSGGLIGLVVVGIHTSVSTAQVRLQSATYDPVTQTVTLVPKQKLSNLSTISVMQGSQVKVSGRAGHPSSLIRGITDVYGNPINSDTTPGKFQWPVLKTG